MARDNDAPPQEDAGSAPERGADFVEAVARGLSILECYCDPLSVRQRGRLTLTDAAKLTGLTRGTARRLLLTLKDLHYLDSDGKHFWLTPKILGLSNAFMVPLGLGDASAAILQELTNELDESASVGILDDEAIVYIERVEVRRIYSSRIVSGTRLPAACSSIGRVLLSGLADENLANWLDTNGLEKMTTKTITNRKAFLMEIDRIRRQGYAIIDEELEIGIRSIAVPIVSETGRVVAALNSSTSTARHEVSELVENFLPRLKATARRLSRTMNW
jgi:IclR family transcriptional regulator, pca regulon regulatory protein